MLSVAKTLIILITSRDLQVTGVVPFLSVSEVTVL